MIIDLRKFVESREAHWEALSRELDHYEESRGKGWGLNRLEALYELYERACYDLSQAQSFASAPELVAHLESIVSRAYGQIYRSRAGSRWKAVLEWIYIGFPEAFRRHIRSFWLATAITAVGALLGGYLVANDPDAKHTLFGGFEHLLGDPSERVAKEESGAANSAGAEARFAGQLMTHNIRVSLLALSLGLLWGFGTVILLFYNGAILGAVCYDYIAAGESVFLAGWLLPHGVIEIPAILIAGQGGLVLAKALLGWNSPDALADRLRKARGDIACLIGGIALMLVWAGIVESYLSQTHEPAIAYSSKIAFGLVELVLFAAFLALSGRVRFRRAEVPQRKSAR